MMLIINPGPTVNVIVVTVNVIDADQVGPVARGGESDEIRIFHILECFFDMMLAAIAKYDFLISKIVAVSE